MSLLSISDTAYAFRFLRLFTMKWEDTDAYKTGVIDEKGNLLVKPRNFMPEQKKAYTLFHRVVFNLRRILEKTPIIGQNRLTNYASALYLIKEQTGMSEEELLSLLEEAGYTFEHDLFESTYIINKNDVLLKGTYKLTEDVISGKTGEIVAKKGTAVTVSESLEPSGYFTDIPLYQVRNNKTQQEILVTCNQLGR